MKTKSSIIFLLLLSCSVTILTGQSSLLGTARYKSALAFEGIEGTNGSAVVFVPSERAYYAVIAGNEQYPLEKFDVSGKSIYSSNAGVDVRGMWWNPKSKSLEINAYSDYGYYRIQLDNYGNPSGTASLLISGQNQPSEQSVASFDPKKQRLLFYSEGTVYPYSIKNGKPQKKNIYLQLPVSSDNINVTTMIYTAVKGFEFGLLDVLNAELLFFNSKGVHTGTVKLPLDAPVYDYFRFSFANNLVWLYSVDYRTWYGYEIFN